MFAASRPTPSLWRPGQAGIIKPDCARPFEFDQDNHLRISVGGGQRDQRLSEGISTQGNIESFRGNQRIDIDSKFLIIFNRAKILPYCSSNVQKFQNNLIYEDIRFMAYEDNEHKFIKALKSIFIGAKVEGASGYINLMKIKANYFESGVFPQLKNDIDSSCKPYEKGFREELFDKLYDFFQHYFSESGSIYFSNTAQHHNIYEKVYTDDRDVMLFWKTNMLYYVKTDRLFNSMDVEVNGEKFYFDVSTMELKRSNEKRELTYTFQAVKNGMINLSVGYSERGRKTKTDEIVKAVKDRGQTIDEETLEKAIALFERQSEVDYFINKNAKAFLREQFDLWMYQYIFKGESAFNELRLRQLQAIKDIAYKIIDFIAQFEDELVRVWNKPKFVLNSHYIITLDKIAQNDETLLKKIFSHEGIKNQLTEWNELGMLDDKFSVELFFEKNLLQGPAILKYQYLPLDTKYFADLELEILNLFDDLDTSLDGWLIHSENYQALNSLSLKFQERIQTIYIDPPFNTGNDFAYVDHFQDSTWLSIITERVNLAYQFLKDNGSFFCHLDTSANYYGRMILNSKFQGQFLNEVVWHYSDNFQGNVKGFANNHDVILWYAKNKEKIKTNKVMVDLDKATKRDKRIWSKEEQKLTAARDDSGKIIYSTFTEKKIDDVWVIGQSSTTKSQSKEFIDFDTQKPEELLRRIILSSNNPKEKSIILDFYLGTGTTIAVAQKLGLKWIGVEMGEHFYDVVIPRMKRVLFGYQSGISNKVKFSGGGFIKYFELEQYEDALRKARYEDAPLFAGTDDTYNSYVFLRDLKMLDAVKVDKVANKVDVNLNKLYSGIDLAETLSCLTGKWIKRITKENVEFQDGTTASLSSPDWNDVKPLIWW